MVMVPNNSLCSETGTTWICHFWQFGPADLGESSSSKREDSEQNGPSNLCIGYSWIC